MWHSAGMVGSLPREVWMRQPGSGMQAPASCFISFPAKPGGQLGNAAIDAVIKGTNGLFITLQIRARPAEVIPGDTSVSTILNCLLHHGHVLACGPRSLADYNGLARSGTGRVKELRPRVPPLAGFERTNWGR